MKEKFSVSFIRFSNGEQYPLLRDTRGQPHWYSTLYTTTQIRNASKAPNTIAAVLAAIRILLTWAISQNEDPESRFSQRCFLNEQELESLRYYAQIKIPESDHHQLKKLPRNIENIRSKMNISEERISGVTHYMRITYIADYLEWLAIRVIEQEARQLDTETLKLIQRMTNNLRARRPQKTNRSKEMARKGLTEKQQKSLLNLIQPAALQNPFTAEFQKRNQLIVLLLYHLGLRAGELLALKISDL